MRNCVHFLADSLVDRRTLLPLPRQNACSGATRLSLEGVAAERPFQLAFRTAVCFKSAWQVDEAHQDSRQ